MDGDYDYLYRHTIPVTFTQPMYSPPVEKQNILCLSRFGQQMGNHLLST